ncbi:TPA: hypothetical protein ACKP2Y_000532 [Pseudomonas putida]
MTKCKFILPVLAAVAMAGCVTTEQMPDGTTKIRFSDETVSSLTSMMPNGLVTGVAGGAGSGGLDLIPTKSPVGNGQYLYFNGQYDYTCASALLYSAKSGKELDRDVNEECRDRYFQRQLALKLAGKPYDRAAPAYDADNPPDAYWARLKGRTLARLAATQQFATRFGGLPRVDRNGNITISVGFMGVGSGQHVALTTTPQRIPVVMEDAGFAAQMRTQSAKQNTEVGDWTTCDAVLAYNSVADRGARPANIAPGDYMQYVVRFTVSSLSCKDALHGYKSASR